MFSNRRGLELPSGRRSCNTAPPVYAYCPPNETPYPSPHPPFLRGHPDYGRYDTGYFQPQHNYVDHRPRGFLDRPSPRLPYVGLDAMPGMPSGLPPVRTVPTSITVPPSKQLRNRSESNQDGFVPLRHRPTYRPGMPMRDPQPRRYDRGSQHPQTTQAAIQLCAWIMVHSSKCKADPCFLGNRCTRVKTLFRHMMQCTADNQCPNDKCYHVKQMMQHHEHCRSMQCVACSKLRTLIHDMDHFLKWNGAKNENAEFYGTNVYTGCNNPVRHSHYRPNFEGSMFPDRVPQDFGFDQEPEPVFYGSSNGGGYLMDNQDGLGLDGQYTGLTMPILNHGVKAPDLSNFKLGTSLFETFCPYEIEMYLKAIRESDVSISRPEEQLRDKVCAVCLLGEQTFQPIQLYCDCCFAKIKRGGMYWKAMPEVKMQMCACHKCFGSKKNGKLTMGGRITVQQQAFQSCKNDECVTETWVECDKCGYWVHASCGLFNRGENNDDAKYMCPFCLKEEMEMGHRTKPELKPISMWGAEELPECPLSDFIQCKVNAHVLQEIERLQMKVACTPLTIRVLMSVKKTTKVQSGMARSFQDLPEKYPYRQKVIGVFQKIHGVDVLIFCMYVQEYGDDCEKPNRRWVNLEYIDSVKHFTPDVRTVAGEALRSIVYQETLMAYVEFVKQCGFEVFYIWACPPPKEGEDYILHCKPKMQRIPSADRLRLWYKKLLKTAKDRSIVTHDSNLMDTFFTCGIDRAAGRPFNAEEMPYFEGDYWPGEAEKILQALGTTKLAECCRKPGEKRKTRGEMSVNEVLENGLMVSLPFPRWSDFMVWHLQEPCSLCPSYITSGHKYVYHFESNGKTKLLDSARKRTQLEGIKLGRLGGAQSNTQFFQICETCYQTCVAIGEGGPLPDCVKFADLVREDVQLVVPVFDTFNEEETKFSEIFESRQAFLGFCKGNHYQFDTLQHAKHSTMMLLYHLHNTTAPTFPTFCRGCGMGIAPSSNLPKRDIPSDICQSCRMKGAVAALPERVAMGGRDLAQFQRMTESFEHAAYCNTTPCSIPECNKMKELFNHAWHCEIGRIGGCSMCRFFGMFLNRHAHFCNGLCYVPECERIKAVAKQQMRLDHAQRSRVYNAEASGSSSSS